MCTSVPGRHLAQKEPQQHPVGAAGCGCRASTEALGTRYRGRGRSSCDLPKLVWKRQLAVPEGTWKVICSTSSAVQSKAVFLRSLLAILPELRTARSTQPRRHGSHLAACPRRAVGVGGGERQDRRGRGAETQWFFWELAEVGIQGTGLEDHSPQGHR